MNRRNLLKTVVAACAAPLLLLRRGKAKADPSVIDPTPEARRIAARCWCDPAVENRAFDPELAEVFARVIDRYRAALTWASVAASPAISQSGAVVNDGFNTIVRPLITGSDLRQSPITALRRSERYFKCEHDARITFVTLDYQWRSVNDARPIYRRNSKAAGGDAS